MIVGGSRMGEPVHADALLPESLSAAIVLAVDHLAANDDTDIFLPSIDGIRLFLDRQAAIDKVTAFLLATDDSTPVDPPEIIRSLVPAGYNGLRLGSQLPPLWNATYLALVLACAPAIESRRMSATTVFSYRFQSATATHRLFDPNIGWPGFLDAVREHCQHRTHVLVTDISDFYHRIRVGPILAALRSAGVADLLIARLARLLRLLEVDRYGLPIGGPASRLLAELALAQFDERIHEAGIRFVRFVDDLRVFADDEVNAYKHLMTVANLAWDEGLSIQKGKTRVLRSRDLLEELDLARSFAMMAGGQTTESGLVPLQLSHDPYSELQARVEQEMERFASGPEATVGVLREFSKVRINIPLARNLLAALRFMDASEIGPLLIKLIAECERTAMVPVFARLADTIAMNLSRLTPSSTSSLRDRLTDFLSGDGAVASVELHRAAALRLLCRMPPEQHGCVPPQLLMRFRHETSVLVRREAIALSAVWGDQEALKVIVDTVAPSPWDRAILAMGPDEVRETLRSYWTLREAT